MVCLATQTLSGESFAIWTCWNPRDFTSLTTPILFFCWCKCFVLIYIWKISWSQFTQSILAKEHESFCAFYEFVLVYILNLEVWTSFHPAIFFFRTMLGYSAHVSVFAIWQTSWDTAVGSFFVTEAICYSPSGDVLFGEDHLLCKWTYTTLVICVVSFRVICWSLSFCSSFISFLSPFPSSTVSGLETVSYSRVRSLCDIPFMMWLSLHMLDLIVDPFIFRALGFLIMM